ncbi:MAG TPA: tetratricopeptide repeat protein [Gallionella sp.]
MSLLLDARKKSQQAQAGHGNSSGLELSLEPHPGSASVSAVTPPTDSAPDDKARIAGKNLFNAKSGSAAFARPGVNRNLLIALGGTVVLLAAGAGYVWYAISPGNTRTSRPINMAATSLQKPAAAPLPPQNNLVPGVVSAEVTSPKPAGTHKPKHATRRLASAASPQSHQDDSVHIEQRMEEPIDPLLNNAYLAYRGGRFDQAQQLYLKALNLDSNNTDALLGLAVIAQRRGEDNVAAHYYAQVLALDPRNAVANAGMSALSNDDNSESRLKTLLNEQQNSSSLHFALGNYYAEHDRWAEAQQSYFNAYKLAPDRAELAFNLAVSLDRLGQNKAAAQYYRRALQLDPENHAGFDHAKISQRIEELTH